MSPYTPRPPLPTHSPLVSALNRTPLNSFIIPECVMSAGKKWLENIRRKGGRKKGKMQLAAVDLWDRLHSSCACVCVGGGWCNVTEARVPQVLWCLLIWEASKNVEEKKLFKSVCFLFVFCHLSSLYSSCHSFFLPYEIFLVFCIFPYVLKKVLTTLFVPSHFCASILLSRYCLLFSR